MPCKCGYIFGSLFYSIEEYLDLHVDIFFINNHLQSFTSFLFFMPLTSFSWLTSVARVFSEVTNSSGKNESSHFASNLREELFNISPRCLIFTIGFLYLFYWQSSLWAFLSEISVAFSIFGKIIFSLLKESFLFYSVNVVN